MTGDVLIRRAGHAGCITLNRPDALNALTHGMCLEIERAITAWASDDAVKLILLDAVGDRAFCSGGDIAKMYETGRAGDFSYGRQFWQDEYRLNAKIARYPKPIVAFLQGFTMGGGVGLGCHAAHRIVGETSQIAMPEVTIGLVPDVGGSLLLAHAPGHLGEYLAITASRMASGDAIYAGFADVYAPLEEWEMIKEKLQEEGEVSLPDHPAPPSEMAAQHAEIDALFQGTTPADIARALSVSESAFAPRAAKAIARNSPLAMACGLEIVRRLRATRDITRALELEYRFTARSMEHGDFIEGIRALLIDKDKKPRWRHALDALPMAAVSAMLRPLGPETLNLEDPT
ncbi:MAG: enoyl-CoA hydratase/isomerase family protein [Pseudomonadota bacterium]